MRTLRHDNGRRGTAASMFGLMLPAILGSVAMGVDWGQVTVAQVQVQAAADAAALAATTDMNNQARAEALAASYASQVLVNGVVPQLSEFTYGVWDPAAGPNGTFFPSAGPDPANNAVRVRTEATVPMYFSALFGVTEVTVRGEAGAGPAVVPNRAPDHAVVLDTTCSMNRTEIRYEREAAQALLDCVKQRSAPESRGGLATFGGVDHIEAEIVEYGTDFDQLDLAASRVVGCYDGGAPCSNTNQASGLEVGLWMLDAVSDTRPDDVGQVIVLMSDGEPVGYNICRTSFFRMYDDGDIKFPLRDRCAPLYGWYYDWRRRRWRRGYRTPTTSDITQWANMAQDAALAAGVDIYTVFYGRNNSADDWLRQNVATSDDLHFRALTADEIADTFVDICVQFTGGSAGLLW